MVPRIANAFPDITRALDQAGLESSWLDEDKLVVAETVLTVMPVKVVRENDAALLAHVHDREGRPPTIVVADRISTAAREALSRAGVAWLDRRGHLWIRVPGVFVNADIPTAVSPNRRVVTALKGAGLDVALALLGSPEEGHGVNELARQINRSPGRVSEILTALRAQGLAGSENRPVTPEIFWAVADEWKPRWMPMPSIPPPEPPERYRLSGTLGALALGAPLVADPERTRPKLYVVDDVDLGSVTGAYGATSGWTAAEVAVCPSRFGFTGARATDAGGYLVASHLVVALDLAQDRARGREVLENWNPEGVARVW